MDPRHNQLLAALPDNDWARWQPRLEPVKLAYDQVLFESGATPASLVFPTTAAISRKRSIDRALAANADC